MLMLPWARELLPSMPACRGDTLCLWCVTGGFCHPSPGERGVLPQLPFTDRLLFAPAEKELPIATRHCPGAGKPAQLCGRLHQRPLKRVLVLDSVVRSPREELGRVKNCCSRGCQLNSCAINP